MRSLVALIVHRVPTGVTLGDEQLELQVGWSASVDAAVRSSEKQDAVGIASDRPAAFMDVGVMSSTEQAAVVPVGRPAFGPVMDVVHVGERRRHVAIRVAARSVTGGDGFTQCW